MRVIHVGRHDRSLEILATHQSRLGVIPHAVPTVSAALTELSRENDSFTILHIYGLERYNEFLAQAPSYLKVSAQNAVQILRFKDAQSFKDAQADGIAGHRPFLEFSANNTGVVVQPFYDEISSPHNSGSFSEHPHHIIMNCPSLAATSNYSYVPHPAEGFRTIDTNDFTDVDRLRVLFIPYRAKSERTAEISAALKTSHESLTKIEVRELPTETLDDEFLVDKALCDCEIVVEEFNDQSYGPFAVEAMVRGKAVLSTNPLYASGSANKMQLCPIVHTTVGTIGDKLSRIQEEPRCLRDFAKRSKTFADRHHHVALVAATTVKLYRGILQEVGPR